ncbi:MAG: hypothetical protein WCL23_04525 [Candidatus Moraniibacteriota bacterium]
MSFFGITFERDIHRVQVVQASHSVAMSFISIYVPAFLLLHGFTLSGTILFFVVFHIVGLAFGLTTCPWLMRRFGLAPTLRLSFPIQLLYYVALNLSPNISLPWILIAAIGGIANILYWMPLNILLVRHADYKKMGSDLGVFFALPKIFGIAGPILSAVLIPIVGFWPMFAVSGFGLVLSYFPLYGIRKEEKKIRFRISQVWEELRKRRLLFFLEGLDNIIEESEWFWGIFVFLIIGSLSVPGIVGGLEALGGALFAILIGKLADRHAAKLVPIAAVLLSAVWVIRFFVVSPVAAYAASFAASFLMMFFLVSYFGMIYRKIKGDEEETFLIVREIPTVLGRLVMFGVLFLIIDDPRKMFFLPIATIALLILILVIKRKRFEPISVASE